jgi:universal stress protein E
MGMNMEKILVVIEADAEQQPALHRAAHLARKFGAELELLLADFSAYLEDGYYFDPVQAKELRYAHGQQRLEELESLAGPLRESGLEVAVTTAWGNPPQDEIIRRVKEVSPSLVVASTRHHHQLARLLLSNADWELVRYCPVPLLLVKQESWPDGPAIIAAVDPDHIHDKPAELDRKLIAAGQAIASATGGRLSLFHSAWLPPLAGAFPLQPDRDEESRKLTDLAQATGVDESACHWSADEITRSLPALVEEQGASLVVMGAVSRSRLDRLLIGNTAERLMDRLSCDVLVIKPDQMPATSQVLI